MESPSGGRLSSLSIGDVKEEIATERWRKT